MKIDTWRRRECHSGGVSGSSAVTSPPGTAVPALLSPLRWGELGGGEGQEAKLNLWSAQISVEGMFIVPAGAWLHRWGLEPLCRAVLMGMGPWEAPGMGLGNCCVVQQEGIGPRGAGQVPSHAWRMLSF